MLAFDIKFAVNNKLDELSQRLVLPVVEIGQQIAVQIRNRVLGGIDPMGNAWTPLGRQRMGSGRGQLNADGSKNYRQRWWVKPTEAQPAGYIFRVKDNAKDFQGWAVYDNYQTYLRLQPNGDRRDWFKSGEFWRSIAVRPQSSNRVKVISTGSRKAGKKRIQNRNIGFFAGRRERFGVLTYSDAERLFAQRMVKASIDEQMATRAGQVAELGRLNTRVVAANRRASKLLGG